MDPHITVFDVEYLNVNGNYSVFQNAPKYVASLNPDDELQIQYEIHSSIDFVEEKLKTGKKDMRELYLGLLYSTEDHKVYPFYFIYSIFANISVIII